MSASEVNATQSSLRGHESGQHGRNAVLCASLAWQAQEPTAAAAATVARVYDELLCPELSAGSAQLHSPLPLPSLMVPRERII